MTTKNALQAETMQGFLEKSKARESGVWIFAKHCKYGKQKSLIFGFVFFQMSGIYYSSGGHLQTRLCAHSQLPCVPSNRAIIWT